MARIRSVHPALCVSETMAELPAELERTFVRLWTHCDDDGRCVDNPRLIKAALYPLHDAVTPATLDAELTALATAGVILRYSSSGKRYIAVTSWGEFQHPQKRVPSQLPEPDATALVVLPEPDATGSAQELGVGEGEGVRDDVGTAIPVASSNGAQAKPALRPFESEFDAFWRIYPKRADRAAALREFQARRRAGVECERLEAAASRYATSVAGRPANYVKNGSTFLHGAEGPWSEWEHGIPPGGEVAASGEDDAEWERQQRRLAR